MSYSLFRLDSIDRLVNLRTTVRYIQKHFDTNIHILEADRYNSQLIASVVPNGVKITFVEAHAPIFNTTAKFTKQQKFADMIRIKQLTENLGFQVEEIPVSLHLQLMKRERIDEANKMAVHNWINTICNRNCLYRYYEEARLKGFLNRLVSYSMGLKSKE